MKINKITIRQIILVLCPLSFVLSLSSCNPEAKYETENVNISINVKTISAGFIECSFSTNKDAYYLIAITEAREGFYPMDHQKQFMTLALDSANVDYLSWRHDRLHEGEFTVAPFSSHSLQYGDVNHFFTGLWFDTEYWIYAFVVDPVAMKPRGNLHLVHVTTAYESEMPVVFEYRVKGSWDYVYPIDTISCLIYEHFPYVKTTIDSVELEKELQDPTSIFSICTTPQEYFSMWLLYMSAHPDDASVLYGVSAMQNDGINTDIEFEKGHTYYTFIGGFDFSQRQSTLYKFVWEGDSTNLYFTNRHNIAWDGMYDESE